MKKTCLPSWLGNEFRIQMRSSLLLHHFHRALVAIVFFFHSSWLLAEPNEYPIGVSLVLSGPWASWGEPVKNGLELGALDSKNAIRFQFQDDRCDPTTAASIFKKFISVDKLGIIVLGCMENIPATLPIANKHGAFVFSIGAMQKNLLDTFPNLISLYSLADAEVYYILPYISQVDQVKTLSIVTHSAAVGEALGESLKTHALAAGIKVLRKEVLAVEETDFQAGMSRVLRDKPDALYIHLGPKALGTYVKKARELGYSGKIYAGFLFESADSITTGASKIEGIRYTYPVTVSADQQKLGTFVDRYKKLYSKVPENTAAIGYDTAILIDRAISHCGTTSADCFTSFFSSLGDYQGIGGKVTFRKDRSALRPYGLKEYRNGKFSWVVPELTPLAVP